MNREIKFRAWNENYKQMKKVYGLDLEGRRVFLDANLATWWLIDYCELMQYTGLKDKNGREIYKGYILLTDGGELGDIYSEVVFNDGNFMIVEKGYTPELTLDEINREAEVAGNIYENLELLEE